MNIFTRNIDIKIVSLLAFLLTACSDDIETENTVEAGNNKETEVFEIESFDRTFKTVVDGEDSLEVPAWLPKEFPFPEGCQIKFDAGKVANMGNLVLICNNSPKNLTDYYTAALINNGWLATDEATSINFFKKEKIVLSVTIDEARKKENHSTVLLLFSYK